MNDEHFQLIDEAYDMFYKDLLRQGKLPLKDTGIGYWGISSSKEVYELFKRIKLHKYKNFLDIGAGDFKVVLIASLFTNATGIEYDKWLVSQAENIRSRLTHIERINNAKIIRDDFMHHNFSNYDVIFWHPDKANTYLNFKLQKELKGPLIVHGPHYHPDGLKKKEIHNINGTYMFLYEKV